MNVIKRFRLSVIKYSIIVVAISSLIALYFNTIIAHGILVGGLAAALGFWVFTIKLQKVASAPSASVQSAVLKLALFRYGLYAAALIRGYTLDPDSMFGLLGAVLGIFIIRFVTIFHGFSGVDLKKEQS